MVVIIFLILIYRPFFIKARTYFRTNELTVNETQRARAGLDFVSIVNSNYALIKNGSSYGSVSITILNDSIPELEEIFEIHLTGVEVAGYNPTQENLPEIGGITRINVTIQENDYPYGLFGLQVEREQVLQNNSQYFVYEPNESRIPITFYISRGKGNISWTVFHCVKSVRIWRYSGPYFPAFGLNAY